MPEKNFSRRIFKTEHIVIVYILVHILNCKNVRNSVPQVRKKCVFKYLNSRDFNTKFWTIDKTFQNFSNEIKVKKKENLISI